MSHPGFNGENSIQQVGRRKGLPHVGPLTYERFQGQIKRKYPYVRPWDTWHTETMTSWAADLSVLVGLLGLFAFVVLSTLRINRNRKVRSRSRRITDRLLNWK